MKCTKCGAELPGTMSKNQHCPICGEVLFNDIPYQQVVDALNVIVSRFGSDIYAESSRMNGLLNDILPNEIKEKNIIRNAAAVGIADIVLKASKNPENMRSLLEQGYTLAENNGISGDWCAAVLFMFGYPLGIDTRSQYQIPDGKKKRLKFSRKSIVIKESTVVEEQNYAGKSIAELESLADEGDDEAAVELAERYYSGNGVKVDFAKAMRFYKRADIEDNPYAQYSIGAMYAGAMGVEHDPEKAFRYYQKAADKGYPPAQYALGEALYFGEGCEKNDSEALYWMQKAEAEFQDANVYIMLSMIYKDSEDELIRDYSKAFKYLQKAVDLQSEIAYNLMGAYYELGIGVEKNYDNARKYYELAASNGVESGYLKLGAFYQMGGGVPKDTEKAVRYYQMGADAGNMYALNALGMCYKNGDGVPQNYDKAFELFMQAASAGNYAAEYNIGLAYEMGQGVPEDEVEAKKWYMLSAEKGFGKALTMLGIYAEQGIPDGKPDIQAAFDWYLKSAETGEHPLSQLIVGNCRTNGLMNSYVDRLEGFEWYLKAAVNGHPTAQNNVAIEYINGEIVDQDYDIAVEWLEKATEQNDMYALNNYGTLLLKGEGVSRDVDRAFNMFLSAAKQGYTDAKLNVGICYYQGWGTQRNLDEALRWLSEAYAEGAANAVDYLKKGFKNKNGYWVKKGFFGRVPAPETLPPAPQIERCTHGCNDCCDYIEHIENEDTKCHCSRLDMDVFIKRKCPFYKKTDAISDLARLARLLKAEKSEES